MNDDETGQARLMLNPQETAEFCDMAGRECEERHPEVVRAYLYLNREPGFQKGFPDNKRHPFIQCHIYFKKCIQLLK